MLCANKRRRLIAEERVIVPRNDFRDELEHREVLGEGMTVDIVGGSSMLTIRMSEASRRIGLLKNVKGRNMVCDHLLFGKVTSTWYAIFVELRTTESHEECPNRQLRWSLPILEYVRQRCELVTHLRWLRPSRAILRPEPR